MACSLIVDQLDVDAAELPAARRRRRRSGRCPCPRRCASCPGRVISPSISRAPLAPLSGRVWWLTKPKRPLPGEIFALEAAARCRAGCSSLPVSSATALDHLAELDLQPARQASPWPCSRMIGDAALARLAVDADHRLVAAAEIGWDRSAGRALPRLAAVALRLRRQALLDRVLVRAGEGGEHQLAGIGMARMDRQLVAVLDRSGRSRRCREMSRPGSTPWVNMFSARVTTSTLPVRSPLPNSVPSTRSAPAISASSAAATPVPRSLCGWTLRMTQSRFLMLRPNHSIWSAIDVGRRHLDRRRQVEDHLASPASAARRPSPPRRSPRRSRARCR